MIDTGWSPPVTAERLMTPIGRLASVGACPGTPTVSKSSSRRYAPVVRPTGPDGRRRIRPMASYFWIAIGSALGGVARYWCSGVAARLVGETFPWGTLAVNIVGSFIIGFFVTLTGPDGRIFVSSTARQFVTIGICGGYT